MKNAVQWLLKAMFSGVLALAVASALCFVYYNPGIHTTNKTGATDYIWQSNRFTSKMTEGIAWGRTDKNGFYNKTSIDKKMDVLVMGSSHMEGTNVFPEQKAPWLLEELTNRAVYNIGTSGHGLLACVKNLETALTVMEPTEYVIIETSTTMFAKDAIDECLSGNMAAIPSYDSGILFHLQKIPYLKLVYSQLKSWSGIGDNESGTQAGKIPATIDSMTHDAYEQLTQKINEICIEHNVQPIVFYHPHLNVHADGSITASNDENSLTAFQSACQSNNVIFIDMTDDFINMYREERVLPHGFCNTSVGAGHLNQYGHRAIAERLAETLSDNLGGKEGNSR